MKSWLAAATAVFSTALLSDARDLCSSEPVGTPQVTPSITTTPPLQPTTTPTPTSEPLRTIVPSVTPSPTTEPPATTPYFYISTRDGSLNRFTLDDVPLGKCFSLGCWRESIGYGWDIIGPPGTTVAFFTAALCDLGTLDAQYPVDAAYQIPQAESVQYQSFVILAKKDVPRSSDITSKKFLCEEK